MKRNLFITLLCSITAGAWPVTATAQNQDSSKSQEVIEEVLVTARRVEENIQDAPVAVTAVGERQLEQMHPHDLADLNNIAPNFRIQGSAAIFRNSAIAFARGIGYNNIDGTLDPALGVSVDGVFYLRNVGVLQNMFDLSGVEIVLGPQGTLYGKNTIAGVLNVTTQRAKLNEWEAKGRIRAGNMERIDTELVANLPLSDTAALRLAFQSQYSDGPYKNIQSDTTTNLPSGEREVGGDDTRTLRASLRWMPRDDLDINVIGTVLRNRSPSVGGTNVAQPGSLAALYLGHPGFESPGGPSDEYVVDRSWPSGDHFDMESITVEVRYMGEHFDVFSVSNFISDETPENWDDFSYAGLLNNYAIVGHEQYSQELRFQSNGAGALQWVAGAFLDHGFYDYWQSFYNYIPVVFGAPGPSITNQWIFQWSDSYSAFGQVDYAVSENLQLTAGVRALSETKKAKNFAGFTGPTTRNLADWPAENRIDAKETWEDVTYRVGARYSFSEDLMGYLSFSTGFHSGGFNSAARAGVGVDPIVTAATLGPWEPEEAKSWEAGVRSEWYDRRLQVNLTAFFTEYENLQSFATLAVDPATSLPVVGPSNGAQEEAKGVELSLTALPMPGMVVRVAAGYLDAEYTSFDTFRNNLPYDCVAQGCQPAHSPEHTLRIDASYDVHSAIGTFTPSITYSWSDEYYTNTFNDQFGFVDSFSTIDAAIVYEAPGGRWSASLWGKNLSDERYVMGFVGDTSGAFPVPAFAAQYYSQPRQYGVELRFNLTN